MRLLVMIAATTHVAALEPLLSIDELAEYLGMPVKTIYEWRAAGEGPTGFRIVVHEGILCIPHAL